MKALTALAFSLALASGAAAQHAPGTFPHVVEGSFNAPDGSYTLEQSVVIEAPAEVLFNAYTDPKEFVRWNAPHAWSDLRVGGSLEASYAKEAHQGDPTNIKQRIVTFLPNRLIVFQNVQSPPGFPHPEEFRRTYIVLRYVPVQANRTRVSVAITGFGDTPADKELEGFFRGGDGQLLEAMKKTYDGARAAPPAGKWQRALVQSVEFAGDKACVWRQFSDEAAIRAQGIPFAHVELKNGGLMEEGFEPQPKPGETIRHRMLTLIPGELMLLRNEATPPGVPGGERYKEVVQAITIEPNETGRITLTIAHTGYGDGADWDKLYSFFESHNPSFLAQVKATCAAKGG